ncbi:tail fiber protein [Candidatus Sodalis pierantonius]|uniref:tail fiber protein n=1 Tax=Candidatus Sodalis pierantonii TaxID=1486991 RepID=UPI00046CDCB0|nr:tail fiber protein [Candidatus Sodalis pierantonius]
MSPEQLIGYVGICKQPATLTQAGISALSNATDSEDDTTAATLKAVKTVQDNANRRLEKAQNLADLPDKGITRNNLDVHSKNEADGRYYPKIGGTVNGSMISLGRHIILQGDDRKHLGFHNQDGSVRMWLYKDKGGDGVRLNNGNDGGGDWVFNKNGHFYSPQALHAAGATYQEDGNVHGAVWGGHLNGWVENVSKNPRNFG